MSSARLLGVVAPARSPGVRVIHAPHFLARTLTSGGDRRIWVRPGDNTNIYGASPFPRSTLGYASSTANDISAGAYRHLEQTVATWPAGFLLDSRSYRDELQRARARIRAAWHLDHETEVVFAPSGTDLEYVALALAQGRAGIPVSSILLGKDEVGSGCALSAEGRYFAGETAVVNAVPTAGLVAGFAETELRDLPIRDRSGAPLSSAAVASRIEAAIAEQHARGRWPLVHAVFGSKTGLVLPDLDDLERLVTAAGDGATFVIDACQARLESECLQRLLRLGCIVMLTGSKFIGGPPFSGFALVPRSLRPRTPLPGGLATIFRRGEWPLEWTGCDHLPDTANPGLLLRIEAALFELERFGSIDLAERARVIEAFGSAVRRLAERLGARLVAPCLEGTDLCLGTLATLDISSLPSAPDFAVARRWHRVLAARGLRLGQPVKCVRRADGEWAGTLRLSLSMPLIAELAALASAELAPRLKADMERIAEVVEAARGPIAA